MADLLITRVKAFLRVAGRLGELADLPRRRFFALDLPVRRQELTSLRMEAGWP